MRLSPELVAKCLALSAAGNSRPAHALADTISEKEFQAAVIDEARRLGWLVYHTFDSRRSARGFPDLVLVRDRVLFLELKSASGRLSADQLNWRDALRAAGGEWHEFRPRDWSRIVEVLG